MKPTDFPHASESFRKLNPHIFGVVPVPASITQPNLRESPGDTSGKATGKRGVGQDAAPAKRRRKVGRIHLTAYRHRLLDDDHNLSYSFKFIQDAVADTLLPGLPPGRADSHFRWEYGQVETRGEQGTIVKIEV